MTYTRIVLAGPMVENAIRKGVVVVRKSIYREIFDCLYAHWSIFAVGGLGRYHSAPKARERRRTKVSLASGRSLLLSADNDYFFGLHRTRL